MPSYYDQVNGLAPKIWYRFNETAGTPVNSGSLSNTLTNNGMLLNEQTDVDGRCVFLDGTDYAELSSWSAFSLFNDKSFTVEVWFKASQNRANYRTLFFNNRGTSGTDLNLGQALQIEDSTAGANTGKLRYSYNVGGQTFDLRSTNAVDDDLWHHAVVAINTTSQKLYIDGQLNQTLSTNISSSTVTLDTGANRYIGVARGGSQSTLRNYFIGRIDEFALYDYELTAQNVLDNFNAGASVDFSSDVLGTASALFVEPTLFQDAILTADPMTADATGEGHAASTIDLHTLLDTYMSGLTLQTWFKFDKPKLLTDYGTEPTRASSWGPLVSNTATGGIQGSGELRLADDANTVNVVRQVATAATGISALLNDENFTIGFWTKKLVKEQTFLVTSYKADNSQSVNFQWNADGGISFTITANNNNHTISSSTDITDGEWHFVVGKLSSNTMQLWIDGTSIGTTTMNHDLSLDYFQFESNGTDTVSLSQFFVTTAAAIGTTEIANMWDYGTPTTVQASAYMPDASVKFNSAFNDYIQSKNPVIDFRLDEGSGSPINFGSASIALVPYLSPQGFTQNEIGLNTRAFKFTDRTQGVRGNYTLDTGTFSTDDLCTIGIVFKSNNATNQQGMVGFGGRNTPGAGDGNGFSLLQLATSGYLRIVAGNNNGTVTSYTGTTNYADGKWHFATIVKSASTVKLYVDGKEHLSSSNSTQMSDDGEFIINGTAGIINTTASVDKLIDEVFVTNTAFSAQEVFEAWQTLRLEMDTTATAEFVHPANIAGTGFDHAAEVSTASSLFEMPGFNTEQILDAEDATASAEFILPNFGGNVVIDVNYGHEAFTADALFHDPQANIGENHIADHMDASAIFADGILIIAGGLSVPPMIAQDAELVDPGIVTIKGAQVFAEPATANSLFPLPPAYIQLSDDDWFVRLLEGHSDKKQEVLQQQTLSIGSNVGVIKGGFLTFFDDVLLDVTPTTAINTITSEIPNHYFDAIGFQAYDNNGNLVPLDTTKNVARLIASRGVNTPTPMLSVGYFDDYERKAVRVENIEIPFPGTDAGYSDRPYNIEFSFRTTKENQVIAYGRYQNIEYTNSRVAGAIGLYNGKIYLAEDYFVPAGTREFRVPANVPHPANYTESTYRPYMLGNKNIADGQWHHVIIQKGFVDDRTQIWIDGVLDKQLGVDGADGLSSGFASQVPGFDGTSNIRPYIVGFNSSNSNLYSDFQISAWNYYPGRFLEERDIGLNYSAFTKSEPIKVEPMTATAKITDNNKGIGNKARALLLYWWPVTREFGPSESITSNDRGQFGAGDLPTFDTDVYTYDFDNQLPQDYYGWDVFPVSITGYKGFSGGTQSPFIKSSVLTSNGIYIDPIKSAPRYLDVINDIDISSFDAIFFRNYPDQTGELDKYIREELADIYFGLKEKDLYEDFIKSLRAAVDTGISLYITNPQLAIDLGIIGGYEDVPDLNQGDGDTYGLSLLPDSAQALPDKGIIKDLHRNNRLRVVNTVDGLTNESGYIWKDYVFFDGGTDEDPFSGEPNRPFVSLENRPNGLQIGDTFVHPGAHHLTTTYEAVPFELVKAGKIVTAFANTIRQGNTEVENPYKNYAACIAVEPGTILNGKAVGGKIFVNFTEKLTGTISGLSGLSVSEKSQYSARDNLAVDLVQDEWINLAYNEGEITLEERNALLSASYNLDRRLEVEIAGLNRPNIIADIQKEKVWDSNGMYILVNRNQIDDPIGAKQKDGLGSGVRRTVVNKAKKSGDPGTARVSTSLQWFSFEYAYQYPRSIINVISMLTRGFRWLSNKIVDDGKVNRVEVMNATLAELPMPVVTPDFDRTVYAQPMLSIAIIVNAQGYALADVEISTLPLFAEATFGAFTKNIVSDVFIANALIRQPRIIGIEEDEIVVYIHHVDPILYIREDIIK